MNTYQLEIYDNVSKQTRMREPPGCGWTEDSAGQIHAKMCDCNLAGYFNAEPAEKDGRLPPHQVIAGTYIHQHGCDHSMPPKRFKAVKAHLSTGEVVQL